MMNVLSKPVHFEGKDEAMALLAQHYPTYVGNAFKIEGDDALVYLARTEPRSLPSQRRLVAVGGKRYRRNRLLVDLAADLNHPDFLIEPVA
jgi:hypothetical protein